MGTPVLKDLWLTARRQDGERYLRLDFSDDWHIGALLPENATHEQVVTAFEVVLRELLQYRAARP